MVPITRRASSFNKKCGVFLLIINQYFSMPAVIVQDAFAGKAGESEGCEEETTGGYFYCYFYWYFYRSGQEVFHFLALELHSRNTHTRMGIRNRRT